MNTDSRVNYEPENTNKSIIMTGLRTCLPDVPESVT